MSPSTQRRELILVVLALAALVLAVFAPSFGADLVNWDDDAGLVDNQAFRGFGAEQLRWMFTTNTLALFQPLAWLSFAVDHALWGLSEGLDAPEAGAWHRTSVALHLAVSLAVLGMAREVLRRVRPQLSPRATLLAAALAAALFAVHPLRAESVAWLTERRDVLSGLGFVGALWAWWRAQADLDADAAPDLRKGAGAALAALVAVGAALAALELGPEAPAIALRPYGAALLAVAGLALVASTWLAARVHGFGPRGRRLVALAVALTVLSLLAKAMAMVLPAVLLICDAGPLRRPLRGATRALGLALEKAPWVALTVVVGRIAFWGQASQPGTMAELEAHTLADRVLVACHGLVWYPWKSLWPSGLLAFVELPETLSASDPRFLVPLVVVALTAVGALALARRAPSVVAALLAYAAIVSPVVGLVQVGGQLVADRYSYLSTLPLALLAAGGLATLAERTGRRAVALAAGGAWVALLAVACQRQVRVWHDSLSLWTPVHAASPTNGMVSLKLAQAHLLYGDLGPEGEDLPRVFELLEGAPLADDATWHATYAQALLERARARPEERGRQLELAIAATRRALELDGQAAPLGYRLNLATALIEAGRFAEAVPELRAYTEARPGEPVGWTNLGVALAASGRAEEGVVHLERAVGLDPGYAKAWRFLAQARERAGDRAGAIAAWRELLRLWPDSQQARARLQALGAGG